MSSAKYFKLTYDNLEGYKNLLTRKLQVFLYLGKVGFGSFLNKAQYYLHALNK